MLESILQSIGLRSREAKLYLAALRTGNAPVSLIAKRAGVSRSTGYNILQRLVKRGMVHRHDRAHVQYYAAISPHEMKDLLERRKEDFSRKISVLKAYLPQFDALFNPQFVLPKMSFFEGIEGIKHVYLDILKKGDKETFSALSLDNIVPELKDWIFNVFTAKKVKKNIRSKVLVSSKYSKAYRRLDKKHLRESLILPHEKYPFQVEIDLYDENKIAFISFDPSELLGVIIESPRIANTLKSLFNLVWDANRYRLK